MLIRATALLAVLLISLAARAAEPACREKADANIWTSPESPVAGEPLRIMAVAESIRSGELVAGTTKLEPIPTTKRGGPPYSFAGELTPSAGTYRVELHADGHTVSCRTITVVAKGKAKKRTQGTTVWENTRAWDRATENFYSAWIEALFDAPPEESVSFPSLAPVLRDPRHNFFYDHLGLREDDPKNKAVPPAEPDCADLPYYLRVYFSWKMQLPFAFRDCDRGTSGRPPRCGPPASNGEPPEGKEPLGSFKKLLRKVINNVHSGSARAALADEQTDQYPVKLTRSALRPGTVYADPYGHVLMIVKWIEQSATGGGRLFAVDGQPDNSVGRKRFWEGTFLFASDVKSAGPGFKAFRPVVGDPPAPLTNAELTKDARFAPFSTEQSDLSPDAFYAKMAALINPKGLDATAAYEETLSALVEQLETRVGSVNNGEQYMREKNNPVVPMPEGPKIFETVGPWEDFATPSRDMRLIIAMNVLLGLPERVQRHPELFVLGGRKPDELRAEVQRLHEKRIRERGIEYRRSDGTPFKLTVADVIARKSNFEIAYNPNDCIEVRWGSSDGSPDFATCHRRSPEDQRARMTEYRSWFRDARRPSR